MQSQTQNSLAGRKALVLGLGQTGVSMAAWLSGQGCQAVFADSREQPPGLESVRALMPGADFICGDLPAQLPEGVTEVLLSPGLSMDLPVLAEAQHAGIPVRSDIDLFMEACTGKVIGVTGSNGKSTVTTLLEKMLHAAGVRVVAGGNLGTPALDLLKADADVFVLELSSFQLERSAELELAAAVVLNVSPDHLDHHGDMEHYAEAKARIYARCGKAVVNRDESAVAAMVKPDRNQIGFTLGIPSPTDWGVIVRDDGQWIARGAMPVMPVSELRIAGRHNLQNVLAAFALADTLTEEQDVPMDGLIAGVEVFGGLPHRMQVVRNEGDIAWINDSKATNEAAAAASIGAIAGRLVLIAGGDAKGGNLEGLLDALAGRDATVIALGKDRELFVDRLSDVCVMRKAESMEEAVRMAASLVEPGDTVLLAPACSSLDMFRNYEERGEAFARAVEEVCG